MIFMVCLIFWYPRSNLEGFLSNSDRAEFRFFCQIRFRVPETIWLIRKRFFWVTKDETRPLLRFISFHFSSWFGSKISSEKVWREKLVSSLVALILPFLSFCVSFLFLKVRVGFTKKTFFAIFRFPFFNQAKLTVMVHFRSRVLTSDVQRLIKSIECHHEDKRW